MTLDLKEYIAPEVGVVKNIDYEELNAELDKFLNSLGVVDVDGRGYPDVSQDHYSLQTVKLRFSQLYAFQGEPYRHVPEVDLMLKKMGIQKYVVTNWREVFYARGWRIIGCRKLDTQFDAEVTLYVPPLSRPDTRSASMESANANRFSHEYMNYLTRRTGRNFASLIRV